MTRYQQEVTSSLQSKVFKDPHYKGFREKTTNLKVLGLRLSVIQEVERAGFTFYEKAPKSVLQIWDQIWNETQIHEVMYLPLFYYRRNKNVFEPMHWQAMKCWINRIENWEHADALCQLYSILYEHHPNLVEPTLYKWNRSKNPWKRRASIVSTIYYASKNRKAPSLKIVFELIEPLIKDEDTYVQKAVGWQLRECYNLNPKRTTAFIEKHLLKLSAITFSYATEKVQKTIKRKMKERRKRARTLAKK